jgi:predicted nucleic acid-binding protein
VSDAVEGAGSGRILLDSGPLGRLANPNANTSVNREINRWVWERLSVGTLLFSSEAADYEIRRELTLLNRVKSLDRLDALQTRLVYLPLDTLNYRRAAELWAESRRKGQPTADRHALDVDVLIAAQAEAIGAVVATENVGHLARLVDARHWRDIV